MPQCICKMCGGTIKYGDNDSTATCEFCGTAQTIVKSNDEKKITLFNRANALRVESQFDKALATYENILMEYPKDAEAHWGICLCRYGIEYVDDPKTKKKIPTCHRTVFNSIFDDIDYIETLKNCDVVAKKLYQAEAEKIDKIQKNILAISQKEEPYDVFICYKETDASGNRTKDSVIAQEIYQELSKIGYKVFFARVTLESKIGSQYEPIIFAALQSSKVMLVVGSSKENFTAPWVKNEWSRFFSFMKDQRGKYLIPCYMDIDAYQMPKEFLTLQSQNINKLGFLQDLIRGLNKIFGRKEKSSDDVSSTNHDDIRYLNLLKRAKLCIEDRDYNKAKELLEDVLNENVECAEAYMCELLIQRQLTSTKDLLDSKFPLDGDKNFEKAVRFGSDEYKKQLAEINERIKLNVENSKKDVIYDKAIALIANAKYDDAIQVFKTITGYKDSDEKIKQIEDIKLLAVYNKAKALMDQANFDQAIAIFKTIEDYVDSKEQIQKCLETKETNRKNIIYNSANTKLSYVFQTIKYKIDENSFIAAIKALETIIDFKDSKKIIEESKEKFEKAKKEFELEQQRIKEERERKEKELALRIQKQAEEQVKLRKIRKDKTKRFLKIATPITLVLVLIALLVNYLVIPTIKYVKASNYYENGYYNEATSIFKELDSFHDSENQLKLIDAKKHLDAKDYETAIELVYEIGGTINVEYNTDGGMSNKQHETIKKANLIDNDCEKEGYDFYGWVQDGFELDVKDYILNLSLIASYEPIAYEITYDLNGGLNSDLNPDNYTIESPKVVLDEPTKEGYSFEGWTSIDYESPTIDACIDAGNIGNKHFVANWKANKYTININLNGGSIYGKTKVDVSFNSYYEVATPKKDGYSFEEYYYYTPTSQIKIDSQLPSDKEIRVFYYDLTAKYPATICVIQNGSTFTPSKGILFADSDIFSVCAPFSGKVTEIIKNDNETTIKIKDESGHYVAQITGINLNHTIKVNNEVTKGEALGLSMKSDKFPQYNHSVFYQLEYNGRTINPIEYAEVKSADVYMYPHDIKINALWLLDTYTITYELNGGTNDSHNPNYFTYESEEISLEEPIKEGYTFIGWTSEDYETPTLNAIISPKSFGNKVFTANWSANHYKITYDENGGDMLSDNSQVVEYGADYTLKTPTKTGYDFVGWEYKGKIVDISGKWNIATNCTFVAKWTPKVYKFHIYNSSGSLLSNQAVNYDSNYTLKIHNRTNYTFEGYYTEKYGQGTKITNSLGASISKMNFTKNVNVYPYYTYQVSFVTNSSSSIVSSIKYNENQFLNADIKATKTDRTFDGWYTDSSLKTPVSYTKSLGNVTLYAKWKEEVPTSVLSWSVNGSSIKINGMSSSYSKNDFIIPDYIAGKEVTYISSNAFKNLSSIRNVVVPDSVTSIGNGAFSGCTALEKLTIPFVGDFNNSISDGGAYLYPLGYIFGTTSYSNSTRTYQQYYTTKYNTTSWNTSYGYYYIPNSLKEVVVTKQTVINPYAFSNCVNIESITLPEDTVEISNYAFNNCTSLSMINSETSGEINIPEGVTSIGSHAFYNCYEAINVSLGDDLTKIGAYAFAGCNAIVKINSENNYELIVPNGVTSIEEYAFKGLGLINTIIIPDNVEKIGTGVFSGCASLEKLKVPFIGPSNKVVTNNDTNMYPLGYFFGSSSYTGSKSISQNYKTSYSNGSYSSSNSNYYIPLSLKEVEVTLQTAVNYGAFQNCSMIESVTLSKDVNYIDAYAFTNCNALSKLNSSVKGEFNIPSNVTFIGNYAFENCYEITNLTLPNVVKKIGNYAFSGCSGINKVNSSTIGTLNIPKSCESIGTYAFNNLSLITSVNVPSSVTQIGSSAFKGMISLETLVVPFVGSSSSNPTYGHLGYIFGTTSYSENNKYVPTTLTKVSITVQRNIPSYAFYNCTNIKEIIIQEDTMSIGSYAFYNCTSLSKLNSDKEGVFNIPQGILSIEQYTFANCLGANKFTMSDNINKIGSSAFSGCSAVTSFNSKNENELVVPKACATIGSSAFSGMSLIKTVTVNQFVNKIESSAFKDFVSLEKLTIPFVGISMTNSTEYCGVLGYIFGYGSHSGQSHKTSSSYTYTSQGNSYDYYIPDTLKEVNVTIQTNIPNYAFQNCDLITSINVLKDNVVFDTSSLTNCLATINYSLTEINNVSWDGVSVAASFASGSGLQTDPYIISNPKELAYFANQVNSGNSFKDKYISLSDNIYLANNGLIIGSSNSVPFSGTFDGNGHFIKDLSYTSSSDFVGLFGYVEGNVKNFSVIDGNITSTSSEVYSYIGVVAYLSKDGTMENVYTTTQISSTGTFTSYGGALIGYCQGNVINSYSKANVSVSSTNLRATAGGLVGYLESGKISNSFAFGNVTAKGSNYSYSRNGGIVGENNAGTMENCYRSESQVLIRYTTSGDCYNNEGEVLTIQEIVSKIDGTWDSNHWSFFYEFPTLKQIN